VTRGLQLYASPRRGVVRLAGWGLGRGAGGARLVGPAVGRVAPLRYVDGDDPVPPDAGWVRVRPSLSGIGGADLALVTGRASAYLAAAVPLPFVPGREVVGRVQEAVVGAAGGSLPAGARVVVDTASGVGVVGMAGGGWSRVMVAPREAVRAVPDGVGDERAVLVDALARAVWAVRRAQVAPGARVLVVGAGLVGLCTVLAVRALTQAGTVAVVTRHPARVRLAAGFGASVVFDPAGAVAGVRRVARAVRVSARAGESFLLGGVDVAFDAAGDARALGLALRTTRAGGRVVVSGVPSGRVDLSPLWARGLELVGAVRGAGGAGAEGVGVGGVGVDGEQVWSAVWGLAADERLDGLVAAAYPLTCWRAAVEHALGAGPLGVVRVAFDPTAT